MKKKKLEIKYVYLEPKMLEEKRKQHQLLDEVFDDIF